MNPQFTPEGDTTPQTLAPATIAATPRDESKDGWVRHAAALIGAVGIAGVLGSSARAQDATAPTTGAPTTGAPTTAAPPMVTPGIPVVPTAPAMGAPTVTGTQGAPAQINPSASQAVAGNSTVPDPKRNANSPFLTIPASGKSATPGDIDILNFALGLEYLEADFYARVVAAHQARAYLSEKSFFAAQKLAMDEAAHVSAITEIITARGATPVAKPEFKFPVGAFISNVGFLDTASAMEETGVGAYLGAAPKVQSKNVLRFAASVYGIETRHASLIRLLGGRMFALTDIEVPLTVAEVMQRVAPFMATPMTGTAMPMTGTAPMTGTGTPMTGTMTP